MDKFLEKLNKAKSKINLSPERKEDLYLKIISAATEREQRAKFAPAGFWKLSLRVPTTIFASILGLMVITASTSFAAERSLPGDVLYPVKRNVNEGIMKLLANTEVKKVAVTTNLVERRIAEATELAATGRLNEEAAVDLVAEIENASKIARAQVAALKESKNISLAVAEAGRAEAAFKAGSAVLRGVYNKKNREDLSLIENVNIQIDSLAIDVEEDRLALEDSVFPRPTPLFMAAKMGGGVSALSAPSIAIEADAPAEATSTQDASQDEIRVELEKTIQKTIKSVSEFKREGGDKKEVERGGLDAVSLAVEEAEINLEEAKKSLENNDLGGSFRAANQSQRKIREAEIIKEAEKRLNIKLSD